MYKGHYLELLGSVFFFVCKHSPVWVLPIATSNIINAATSPDENTTRTIFLNVVLMVVMISQNVLTELPSLITAAWLSAEAMKS